MVGHAADEPDAAFVSWNYVLSCSLVTLAIYFVNISNIRILDKQSIKYFFRWDHLLALPSISGEWHKLDEPHVQWKSLGELDEIHNLFIIEVANDNYIELNFLETRIRPWGE